MSTTPSGVGGTESMALSTLIDSSVLVAAANTRETHHLEAAHAISSLAGERAIIPITILTETLGFVRTRYGLDHHRRLWARLQATSFEIFPADTSLLEEARRIDERYADIGYGFADCTLLASCEVLRTARVLSFDRRLAAYRPSFASVLEVMP